MRTILFCGFAFAAGFVAADFMAYKFALEHGVSKYGGLFSHQKD